jgi:predicted GH43/DUF377 family glycosyl hydrolase
MIRSGSLLLLLLLAGCGRYGDFTLPVIEADGELPDYHWQLHPDPVLGVATAGEWDSVDVLNPSVVERDGLYFNFYSGFDGKTWHTGLATSPDGLRWEKLGRILSPDPGTWEHDDYIAANGSAVIRNGEFFYWYQGGRLPRIGLARSVDGRSWTKLPEPVLDPGPRGSWDERGVGDPYVVEFAGVLYMYYLGQDRARRQRLGLARSRDGISWEKLRSNPVLELGEPRSFDDTGLGEPAVWQYAGRYWMLYTARDRREYRRLGLATSPDGVAWKRVTTTAALAGDQPWNKQVLCDPTVQLSGNRLRMWFGGGDVPAPAENLSGQIGYGELVFSGATP